MKCIQPMSKLSVVIIALNEEHYIGECLASVQDIADEIIVVDSGSTDRTIEISKHYTDKVIPHDFETLGKQKQFALDQATGDWILSLDADERVSEELATELKSLLSDKLKGEYDAYSISFQNHFLGKPVSYGGENYAHNRLFRRERGCFTPDVVHESIAVKGRIGRLNGVINHYSYKSLSQVVTKFSWYAEGEALKMQSAGEQFSWWRLIKAPLSIFRQRYLRQQGYRDGLAGLLLALLFAYYHLLSQWYYRELLRRSNR